jgi:hypothetical protein
LKNMSIFIAKRKEIVAAIKIAKTAKRTNKR